MGLVGMAIESCSMTPGRTSHEREGRRVLVLTDDLGGGTGNHLLGLADHLSRSGWNLEIVSFSPRTARGEPSVPHVQLPDPGGPGVFPLHQVRRFLQVRALIRNRRPDIVHAYFFWPILYSRFLRLVGQIPRLVENREDEGFAWGRHEYAWLRLTRRAPDRIVCVAEAVRGVVVEKEAVDPDRTTVIHNGIELPEPPAPARVAALRRELEIPEGAPVVGMVANLNREVKGVDRFLRAVPEILDRSPKAYFVVVGGGTDLSTLRAVSEREGVGDRVQFVGYREDVDRFYALMDVSVLTSLSEGLSITLLESMGHGVPVVATRVGGNAEVVEDGKTGFLVSSESMSAFNERVTRLLGSARDRAEMGKAAREHVDRHFSLAAAAQRYADLFLSLLNEERFR